MLTREPTECRSDEHKSGDEDDEEVCEPGLVNDEAGVKVTVHVPFVVGAEGASRRNAVMRAMDDDSRCGVKMVRFPDTNPRVYKTIPINLPESYRNDLNYSARTDGGVALDPFHRERAHVQVHWKLEPRLDLEPLHSLVVEFEALEVDQEGMRELLAREARAFHRVHLLAALLAEPLVVGLEQLALDVRRE